MSRHTLAARCRFELDVKKSRFIALAAPVERPDAALAFLDEVADRAATHNCWAYRIGQQYRFSDDGEPGGTAGRPILAAIDGSGLDGVVVVVTRWYGGIKLGAGGLIRAYGGAAAECLRIAERVELVDQVDVNVRCAFEHLGSVHGLIAACGADKLEECFTADGVSLRLRLPANRLEMLKTGVRDASRGKASLQLHDSPLQ